MTPGLAPKAKPSLPRTAPGTRGMPLVQTASSNIFFLGMESRQFTTASQQNKSSGRFSGSAATSRASIYMYEAMPSRPSLQARTLAGSGSALCRSTGD